MWGKIEDHGCEIKHEHIHSQNPQNTKCAEAAGVFFFFDSKLEDRRMSNCWQLDNTDKCRAIHGKNLLSRPETDMWDHILPLLAV